MGFFVSYPKAAVVVRNSLKNEIGEDEQGSRWLSAG
tara:strand:- start:401 stop:508 length:108 start_codon:yes stop_codon:yes gene_type:complete